MATNKTVTVLTPNGRRQNVKVTPNTTILQILEDVCKKHKLNPSEYDIKHHNNTLDTTVLMQFSGLPNNAQLEMSPAVKVRQETEVVLCMQLENGERLMGNFQPGTVLWDVVLKLCPGEAEANNIVIIYMRNELIGKENLLATPLRSLGITGGRAMVRLVHRSPEELKVQANVSAPLPIKPSEEKPYKRTFIPTVQKESLPEPQSTATQNIAPSSKFLDHKTSLDDSEKKPRRDTVNTTGPQKVQIDEKNGEGNKNLEKKRSDEIVFDQCPDCGCLLRTRRKRFNYTLKHFAFWNKRLGERNALAFTLETSVPHEDMPDEFFDLTVKDAKTLLKDLKRRRREIEEQPLQTKEYRELEKDKKVLRNLNQYKRSVIRIQFPDRTVLQGTFKPIETVQIVQDFVKEYLSDNKIEFVLYTTPPKNVLNPDSRLVETDCVPCAVLHFGPTTPLPENVHYLRPDLINRFTSFSAASLAASKSRGVLNRPTTSDEEDSSPVPGTSKTPSETLTFPSNSNTPRPNRQPPPRPSDQKVPKWFKP